MHLAGSPARGPSSECGSRASVGASNPPPTPELTRDDTEPSITHHAHHPRHRRPDPARPEAAAGPRRQVAGAAGVRPAGPVPGGAGPARGGVGPVPLDEPADAGPGRPGRQARRAGRPRRRRAVSFGIDVNLLLYASDEGSPQHARAAGFLAACAGSGQVFCLAWLTVMSYLRMATHPSLFARPLSHADAMRNVEALTALPHCRVIGELDGFWAAYAEVTREVSTRGNLVPDAHLATVLRQNGIATLYTHDRDFRKFGFLDVRDPVG
ncbi:TA system VapC family ribonuclease toxin [Piscinibacter sakaiensis]|uniref:TA system VapC family ribonuclease toxin n=1 Tax=Piscinibacter sakaiensis TaxID=1547922 RepID=UPI003727F7B4